MNFNDFVFAFVNIALSESENFKTLLLQITSERFQLKNLTKLPCFFFFFENSSFRHLAVRDCVCRGHCVGICQSCLVRPSIRLSPLSQLSQNLLSRFVSNFSCCLPGAIRPDFFYSFIKQYVSRSDFFNVFFSSSSFFFLFLFFFFCFALFSSTHGTPCEQKPQNATPPLNHF